MLFFTAAHFLSPVSRRLAAGREVRLVLLNRDEPMFFVYHPVSGTVNAVRLPGGKAAGGAPARRAAEIAGLFSPAGDTAPYIEVKKTDLDAVHDTLDNWRSRPARLAAAARFLIGLKKSGATDLSAHDLLLLSLEALRLDSSDFIKEDFERVRPAAEEAGDAAAVIRVEVLNASGRRDLAVRAARHLRTRGFDVISYGTHGSGEKRTKIVNCSDNIEAARKMRAALGLDGLEIYSRFDKLAIAQVRVILGADFDEERGLK